MILRDDDRPIRLRPGKPRVARHENTAWAGAYRLVMHYARGMRKGGKTTGPAHVTATKPYRQRCAVRITYLNNRTRGQWKAHGRYLARESATAGKDNEVGFNHDRSDVDVARELDRWQSSGDPRIWKIIVSPEFGDRVDLQRLTREMVDRMEKDLGTDLEWVAVTHHNTEHAHVHMVIRGLRSDGQPLQIRPAYLKHGIREVAEDLCTRQIGYRTRHDAAEAERWEIGEHRFTSLDRAILHATERDTLVPNSAGFVVIKNPAEPGVLARLAVLQRMGLAESTGANTWNVRGNLTEVLRAMQRAADRQKTLAAHGVPISDNRLTIEVLDLNAFTSVEMELLRADGGMRANSYLRLRRMLASGRSVVQVQDLGDSEKALNNRALLGENARALLKRGVIPTEDGWGGWLGRYQAAIVRVAHEIKEQQLARGRRRDRDLSRGR